MTQKRSTKRAFWMSALSLLLCVSMLVGTTYAWFTDEVVSGMNTIMAGNLDVALLADGKEVDAETELFDDVALWEPGAVVYENLQVVNKGSLALQYQMALNFENENELEGHKLSEVLKVAVIDKIETKDRATVLAAAKAATNVGSLCDFFVAGSLEAEKVSEEQGVVIFWEPGENDNLYNANNGKTTSDGEPLHIEFGVKLVATQEMSDSEKDSFGFDYDEDALFPELRGGSVTASVPVENGYTTRETKIEGEGFSATVPAGVKVKDGVSTLTLSILEKDFSEANLTLEEFQELRPLDVHIEGVAADNDQAILVTIERVMTKGLNMGNYTLYHVENGTANPMTLTATPANHNDFHYEPTTGDVVLALKSFSEVALVAEPAAWKGKFDYTWYNADVKELFIANADQLAAFGAIVGGMVGQKQDSFEGKTVKLISDVNLGDDEKHNSNLIFYPIGYYNSEGTYERTNTAITSGLRNFEGTFDGNGHTVSNFYHNTWEMKGDHDWYTPEEQYYRDGMGLFGRVYGGTVKNLTVENFSSDGEIATTGVIAAYADGATFENIAIFNCNPRVYNIGNGGIVGCVGWYAKEAGLKTTFTNITVDNSNKISALWGSYDVPCGGIVGQYYPTSGQTSAGTPKNDGMHFENCHVSAQMDVYNDVCANYQYYAYRYAGMLIGSVRENETIDGRSYPKMDNITASDCTVHFGTWNDYYYCEIIDNTTASYTHDYQMSRLTEIKAINGTTITYLDGTTGTVPASGRANYVIVDYTKGHGTENATCYHFKDGAVWTHDMGGIQTGIDENGDGKDDLKEDKQHIYLEFNNLVTGYGWGVTTKGVDDVKGVTILDREVGNSVKKFSSDVTELANNKEYKLGDIFKFVDKGVKLVPGALAVSVTNLDEKNPVSATIAYDRNNWEKGTITLTGTGKVNITIQDYYFCTPTTITVNVTDRQTEVKFESKFNNKNFTYRVGNDANTPVKLGSLFAAKYGVKIGTVSVAVDPITGNASGVYTSNSSNWENGTIQFSGNGKVKLTITDNDYCIPTELTLEVVDAKNVTTATSATANNVVLLNDCGFSSLEVSGGYTLYGNGFTMTCASDSAALNTGYEFVALNNGTLDNVQIVCPNFDHAVLYSSNMTESGNRKETTDRTRYFNVKSAVEAAGNSQILNSRISGGRAAVNVVGGNCVIDNSRVEGGAVATVLVGAANSLTLRDATLVQKPTESTYRDENGNSKTLMGFSVLILCDSEGNSTPITLEGTLVQNAWVNSTHKKYVPSDAQDIVEDALKQTDYLHDIDGDGTNESLNLGFAYMPETAGGGVNQGKIKDDRSNKTSVPYEYADVKYGTLDALKTYVYSYQSANGTQDAFKNESGYVPNAYSDIIAVSYSDTAEGLTIGKSLGTDDWVYELNVDLDKASNYKLDFSKLAMTVNGVVITDYKVNGGAKPASSVAVTSGGTTYTLTATVDRKEYKVIFKVTGTETSKDSPSLVGTPSYGAGFGVANSYNGDWSAAAPVLDGITIRYWSVAESEYKEFALSGITFANTGKQNGSNSYWEYTHANNDFTLKITNTKAIHDKSQTFGIPVAGKDGKLYFTIAGTGGFVGNGTTSRSIEIKYEFTDNNGGKTLTFSHTFAVNHDKTNQFNYNSFVKDGTLTKLEESCLVEGTMITMANGEKKPVEELQIGDMIMVFNHITGKHEPMPMIFNNHADEAEAKNCDVLYLEFSNGTELKIVQSHGLFDTTLMKYVYIDYDNYGEYIGHKFHALGGEQLTLTNAFVKNEKVRIFCPVTYFHLNSFANGLLTTPSLPFGITGVVNYFEYDYNLKYNAEAMQRDIETYGLYTYADFSDYISEDVFNAFPASHLKVAVGKGMITYEQLVDIIYWLLEGSLIH